MPQVTQQMVTRWREEQDELYAILVKMADDGKPFEGIASLASMLKTSTYDITNRITALRRRRVIILRRAKGNPRQHVVEIVESGNCTMETPCAPAFWTEERKDRLRVLFDQVPKLSYRQMAAALGTTPRAVEFRAQQMDLTPATKDAAAQLPPTKRGEPDPLLARLIQVYGRQPFKGAIHKPDQAPQRVSSAPGVVLREANC